MAKKPTESPYAHWLGSLTPETRDILTKKPRGPLDPPPSPAPDEDTVAYAAYRLSLTPETREILDKIVPAAVVPETGGAKYVLVEGPDGEWPVPRLFRTPEALARRMSELEGTDTVAWAFYGLPLPFTKGPARYLFLPGGDQAVQVPPYQGGPCQTVDGDLLTGLELQEDGFLGPLCLSEHRVAVPAIEGGSEEEQDDDGVAEPAE